MTARWMMLIVLGGFGCVPDALPDPMPADHPGNRTTAAPPPAAPSNTLDLKAAARADAVLPPVKQQAGRGHMHHGGHKGTKGKDPKSKDMRGDEMQHKHGDDK